MKYIKRQTTNARGTGLGRGVHVTTIDKEVILDSENVVLVPKGRTEDRPQFPKNGHLRYNTDDNRFETYEAGSWNGIRQAAPSSYAPIKAQNLGNGDAVETVFGPLDSGDPFYPVPAAAENVLVFVENVYQLPNTNYSLVQNPSGKPAGWYIQFASAPPSTGLGGDPVPITVLHNFDK
jgi:hypothetical protein